MEVKYALFALCALLYVLSCPAEARPVEYADGIPESVKVVLHHTASKLSYIERRNEYLCWYSSADLGSLAVIKQDVEFIEAHRGKRIKQCDSYGKSSRWLYRSEAGLFYSCIIGAKHTKDGIMLSQSHSSACLSLSGNTHYR